MFSDTFPIAAPITQVEGSAAYAPMMLAPGNHEDQFHFAAHLNRTLMPQQGTGPLSRCVQGQRAKVLIVQLSPGHYPALLCSPFRSFLRFYYSFDYGCVHFISFSTEHTIDKNTEQWDVSLQHELEPKLIQGTQFPLIDACTSSLYVFRYQFVMADLKRAQANRDKVPWIVVYTHHPFYCSDLLTVDRCMKQAPHYRAQLEDAFKQYGVDVFVSGHNHK